MSTSTGTGTGTGTSASASSATVQISIQLPVELTLDTVAERHPQWLAAATANPKAPCRGRVAAQGNFRPY